MSNNAGKIDNATSNLKSKVWKKFGFSKEVVKLDKKPSEVVY